MATYVVFRLLNLDEYGQLQPILETLALQHLLMPTAEASLQTALDTIQSVEFRKNNYEADLIRSWPALVEKGLSAVQSGRADRLTGDESACLSEILIACLCMPSFQFYYTAFSETISENCFMLGQWDDGLLLVLRQSNDWFDAFFAVNFPLDYMRYAYGNSMAIFDRKQLPTLVQAIQETAVVCAGNRELLKHHTRFAGLAQRALNTTGHTLAVSFE